MAQIQQLFIAEKPSLAKEIALARAEQLGVEARLLRSEAYWDVGPDWVTWYFGHMHDSAQPKDYGEKWANWTLDSLPIVIPEGEWKRTVYEDKKAHMRLVSSLVKNSTIIVNCGDPAREGQLLIDESLYEMGINPFGDNIKRLWVQSMARKDMLAAIDGLRPNAEKRTLFDAAFCRQRADFQHGMTNSRLYTILARNGGADATVSVGRVQTPTLRLIVDRDRERLRFKSVDYFLPKIVFRHAGGPFTATWVPPAECEGMDTEGRLVDKAVAQGLVAKVSGKTGRVSAYKAEAKSTPPPLLFDLPTLQSTAGAKFSLTAEEVLNVAQALYERHKATTYPRTDSRHLPVTLLTEEAPGIVRALAGTEELREAASGADMSLRSAAWDDSKVSDHHGLIPTSEFTPAKLAGMDDVERKVFLLIAQSFLAQFRPSFKYRALSVEVSCEGERFKASGQQVTDQGWKKIYGAEDEEEDKDGAPQSLPAMAQGDPVQGDKGELNPKRTSPPPPFTDPTLITAMANIHRYETNAENKKQLRDGDGIGTPATRAATIVTNIDRGYFKRKGKSGKDKITLESTELGRSIIDMLPEELTSATMTAVWERALAQVEKGELAPERFMAAQAADLAAKVEAAKGTTVTLRGVKTVAPLPGHGKDCPACGKGKMITREITSKKDPTKKYKLLACTNYPECKHGEFEEPKVDPLPGHGKACTACGKGTLNTREITGKKDPTKKYKLLACTNYPSCKHGEWPEPAVDPLPGHGKPCPECGKGTLNTREITSKKDPTKKYKLLACTNYPACKHGEWPDRPPQADVPPLPGDGKACPACGKGHLRTKQITAKTGKTHVLLSCDNYPSCKHGEWPDRPPQGDVSPLPGHGKDCAACGKGKMLTKEITGKDGNKHKLLSCNAYPACKNSEWPDRGDKGGDGGRSGGGRK